MLGKATQGRKKMELLHSMMEGRDYGQLKDLMSDSMSETCYKQQKTKERKRSFNSDC